LTNKARRGKIVLYQAFEVHMLFEYKDVDKRVYDEQLRDFLPPKIIDIHTHVWKKELLCDEDLHPRRVATWPSRVADENTAEHLVETYSLLFPDKEVTPLIFSYTSMSGLGTMNAYVGEVSQKYGFPALYFSHPNENPDELEKRIREGGFIGVKSYLNLAPRYIPGSEIRIYDFFPRAQLERLNKMKAIVMLHIPRPGRFADEVNLSQIEEIAQDFMDLRLIIAHLGRAYTVEQAGNAFKRLSEYKNLRYDFSANTNADVMTMFLENIDSSRLMFGSDLPILRMRSRRIVENGIYINLVPPGLYGDVSDDKNMREVPEGEAKHFSFLLYEQILSFKNAALRAGLTSVQVEEVFYGNAKKLIEGARKDIYKL
jgi:predicted TIM-barrel fold metal-dependent hydrolase